MRAGCGGRWKRRKGAAPACIGNGQWLVRSSTGRCRAPGLAWPAQLWPGIASRSSQSLKVQGRSCQAFITSACWGPCALDVCRRLSSQDNLGFGIDLAVKGISTLVMDQQAFLHALADARQRVGQDSPMAALQACQRANLSPVQAMSGQLRCYPALQTDGCPIWHKLQLVAAAGAAGSPDTVYGPRHSS